MKILDKFNYFHSKHVVDGINTIDEFFTELKNQQSQADLNIIIKPNYNKKLSNNMLESFIA